MSEEQFVEKTADISAKRITIALAGNPNCGKTTMFNNLTGARQHVGNWPGVTVEKKSGTFTHGGTEITVVDLPGTYSLTAYSLEEVIARNFIVNESPDAVVDIVDASNLERNLYLTAQILELGVPVVVCLNMIDVAKNRKLKIDPVQLGKLLGAPVVPTVGRSGKGTDELKDAIADVVGGRYPDLHSVRIPYGAEVEKEIGKIEDKILADQAFVGIAVPTPPPGSEPEPKRGSFTARWLAVKLIEQDEEVLKLLDKKKIDRAEIDVLVEESRDRLRSIFQDDPDIILTDRLFSFARGATAEVLDASKEERVTWSDRIDTVLTNRLLGLPIFALFMYFIFTWTFTWSEPFSAVIEAFFAWMSGLVLSGLGDGLVGSLVGEGILKGVGGVLVFLPPIMLLFLFFSFLEDTGYMARAAFLMDRLMHVVGLHGKSFIVLLTSFGCNAPAVMAARTMESRRDRLITILIAPLMSCSARLPVYVLFAGALFAGHAGLVIFIIYITGIALAMFMAWLFSKTIFRSESSPFVMELPPYRVPTVRSIVIHMWDKASIFVKKAGTVILVGVVIVWFLQAFPRDVHYSRDYDVEIGLAKTVGAVEIAGIEERFSVEAERIRAAYPEGVFVPAEETTVFRDALAYRDRKIGEITEARDGKISMLRRNREMEKAEFRYAGRLGKLIAPVLKPLGLDWRAGISLIPGFVAKEVVVGSLGIMYAAGEDADEKSDGLRNALRRNFTPLTAVVFMLFTLLYIPCLATVGVIRRETGSWKWTFFAMAYSIVLAYVVCLIVYQVGRLFFAG
ncbi:MAG: ferrous iron transport protein B [Planctomycetota bacterium]